MKKLIIFWILALCAIQFSKFIDISYAGSADVLPKGVVRVDTEYSYYFPVDKKFDPEGDEEDLSADFNTSLDSNVFSSLSLVEAGFGMPAGSATLGDSVVDFEHQYHDLILYVYYGLTDTVSIGLKIPYYWNKNKVNARLDTANATVGLNSGVPGGIAPLAVPGTVPLTTSDVQNLLTTNFGFAPIESWSGDGVGDMEIGARWQYFSRKPWTLAVTGGVRLPTGDVDDPDNLVDIGYGSGAWALLLRLHNDYTGFKNIVLSANLEYDIVLPDSEIKRVPEDANKPLTANKEDVDRNLGDIFCLKLAGEYSFTDDFSMTLDYIFGRKFTDHISGDMGYNYKALEDETDWEYQDYKVGFSYSTFSLFKAKKFPVPLMVGLEYENVFAGKNNFLKQELLTFSLSIFF